MSDPDDYCELCDLPRSQCIHGRPPTPPPATATKAAPRPRKRAAAGSAAGSAAKPATAPARPLNRRFTPPEVFKPLIEERDDLAGGELEVDDLFLELEIRVEDRLLPGDSELTPEGELRWRYAARRARMALVQEGLMTRGTPGVWQLARSR